MIEWKYHDYRPEGFECWNTDWNKFYSIAVSKIGETRYTVRWYYKGMTEIKEHIDAKNWDEAKALAIITVKMYFDRQFKYWQNMRNNFTDWVEEPKWKN